MLSLFGIPFMIGTLIFGTLALMTIAGKIVVRIGDDEGVVFTGIGSVGRRQRFDPGRIESVRTERQYRGNLPALTVVLDGPQKLRFGSGLSENRRDFVANALRVTLAKRKGPGVYREL